MALTCTTESATAAACRGRRRLHLHCKHRHRKPVCFFYAGIFHKRYLLFLTILYITGLITCAGPLLSLLQPPPPPPPGALYRSQELFLKLWPEIQSDNSSAVELDNLWRYRRKLKEQKLCQNGYAYQQPVSPGIQRYLVIEANGGLNQQRSSICNAVAVARMLNATLVIPHFDVHKVWKDPSKFADIYDEDHFISSLKDYIMVVRNLPDELMESYNSSISAIPSIKVPAWAPARYYMNEVYPVLQDTGVIRISPFANRLSTSIPPQIQHIRCLANYKALRFSSTITDLAKTIANRMTNKSMSYGGKYVSVHIRFEEDMVAFSCCVYDEGETEKSEMEAARKRGWGKKFALKNQISEAGLNRVNGKCPMTPVEVGLMLRGMGFSKNTPIYLASGRIYKEDTYLEPLRKMFPLLETKWSLATADELASVKGYSSRLAAVDYMLCLYSEVFVTTQGGNFPNFLMGQRRFIYNGHAKTIMPDKTKLVVLLQNTTTSWEGFKDEMDTMLAESDRRSIMVPRAKKSTRKGSIYSNPLPECRCLWESQNSTTNSDFFL
ncbi:O-fucosyltransferase 10-like isoform X1 [Salvia hispanica]|uniref:O-fucosyltransferase 10-like isoform X1 n=1 Tax=Salvia hispanica TaxID=49212 RepID=UPI00200932D4|nr:O-fucosyltransferase 10-like isoform X1 [Salvia hispanica]